MIILHELCLLTWCKASGSHLHFAVDTAWAPACTKYLSQINNTAIYEKKQQLTFSEKIKVTCVLRNTPVV